MKAVLISHPFLNHNIMIIMEKTKGMTIDLETGFQTHWNDDNGEDKIDEIAISWLEFQSYIHVPVSESHPPKYTSHYWWNRGSKATVDERLGELKNMIMEVYSTDSHVYRQI